MHNCLILGSGRSGTSMVAGALAGVGYFMGERLYKPTLSNPRGNFEDVEVNAINEAILTPVTPWTPPRFRPARLYRWVRRNLFPERFADGDRWLAPVPLGVELVSSQAIEARIQVLTARAPFCFKDPRFCYTLPIWRPWLQNTRFVCVFRKPTISALSMVQESQAVPELTCLRLTYADCLEVWRLMYTRILEIYRLKGDWLFLHYDQVLDGSGLDRLAAFLDVMPNRAFPDPALRRTQSTESAPDAAWSIYTQLCEFADTKTSVQETTE